MKLWIDDVRPAPEGYVWYKSVNEAKEHIEDIEKDQQYFYNLAFEFLHSGERLAYHNVMSMCKRREIELIDMDHDSGDYNIDGGDRTKCDFYPEVREKALKECQPNFGEWISVEDRLPENCQEILVYRGHHSGLMNVYTYMGNNEWEDDYGYWGRMDDEGITHWMPLPEPPTEKEN